MGYERFRPVSELNSDQRCDDYSARRSKGAICCVVYVPTKLERELQMKTVDEKDQAQHFLHKFVTPSFAPHPRPSSRGIGRSHVSCRQCTRQKPAISRMLRGHQSKLRVVSMGRSLRALANSELAAWRLIR